jgi:hypothetical protein
MKNFSLVILGAFLSLQLDAQITILKILRGSRAAHLKLDNSHNYRVGDTINFYKNRKLVSQGKLTFVTPHKTKAIVEISRGKLFEPTMLAAAPIQRTDMPQRKIASVNSYSSRTPYYPARFSRGSTQDLHYYPNEKSFLLTTLGSYSHEKASIGSSDTKTTTYSLNTGLIYSPAKDYAFGVDLSLASKKSESSGSSDSASGLTDPNFLFSYQFQNPGEDNFFWVLVAKFSPSLGKSKDNNVLRGNHKIQLGTVFGNKVGQWSWSLGPHLNYFTESKFENFELDPYYEFALDMEAQYDFNSEWALYMPLLTSYTSDQRTTNASVKIKTGFSLGAGLGAKYAVSNDINLLFNALYQLTPSVKVETVLPSSDSGDISTYGFNFGANFKF